MMNTQEISLEQLKHYSEAFNSERSNRIAANIVSQNGMFPSIVDYKGVRRLPQSFSIELPQGAVTAQKQSGRCWSFASLNMLRSEVVRKWNLKDIFFSENYIFFYDKLEKSNFYLEHMLQNPNEPLDGRWYRQMNERITYDGGQWDMFRNIVKKYGIVPREAYPDTPASGDTKPLNYILAIKLREFAAQLRALAKDGADVDMLREKKEEQLETVYRILVITLGEPPKSFDFLIRDKSGKVYEEHQITPIEFYNKYVGIDFDDYVGLFHAPTDDKPYRQVYTAKYLGNVIEGRPVTYLNLPIEELKAAAIAQLTDGHPVWFGADCIAFSLREEGVFDRDSLQVEDLFDIHYDFDKGMRLKYKESFLNHVMVFQGVNLDENGKPDRWKIENSWGGEVGRGGYFVGSDKWFDEYVFQVNINRKYLSDETLALLSKEPVELKAWDPLD